MCENENTYNVSKVVRGLTEAEGCEKLGTDAVVVHGQATMKRAWIINRLVIALFIRRLRLARLIRSRTYRRSRSSTLQVSSGVIGAL